MIPSSQTSLSSTAQARLSALPISTISLASYNIRSIINHPPAMISECMSTNNIHVMALQEFRHNLVDNHGIKKAFEPNRCIISTRKTKTSADMTTTNEPNSVMLIIGKPLKPYITSMHRDQNGRIAAAELSLPRCKLCLICAYCPPTNHGASSRNSICAFLNRLDQVINSYISRKCQIIIMGDLNIDLDKKGSFQRRLRKILINNSLIDTFRSKHPNVLTSPGYTFERAKSKSRIDYILASRPLLPFVSCNPTVLSTIHNLDDHIALLGNFSFSDMTAKSIHPTPLVSKTFLKPPADKELYNANLHNACCDTYGDLISAFTAVSKTVQKKLSYTRKSYIKHKDRESLTRCYTEVANATFKPIWYPLPVQTSLKVVSMNKAHPSLPPLYTYSSNVFRIAWLAAARDTINLLRRQEQLINYEHRKKMRNDFLESQDKLMDSGHIKQALNHLLDRHTAPINSIMTDDGISTCPETILETQRAYFAKLAASTMSDTVERTNTFLQSYPAPEIIRDCPNHFDHITSPITLNELRAACNHMASGKSPGPDSITPDHFKMLDDENLSKFLVIINDWLCKKKVDPLVKHSLRVCIPKGKSDTSLVENQRPISLTPIASRLFSHILVKRLAKPLKQVLCPAQTAFLPGRSAEEHIFTLRAVLEDSKQFDTTLVGAFLDLAKAYDSVEHWAIEAALIRIGFKSDLIELIMDYHHGATAAISSPWGTSDVFSIQRGVLQGDPMACLIFLIFMDPIISKISTSFSGYKMQPFPTADTSNVSSLQIPIMAHADDITLLAASFEMMNAMLRECHFFFSLTGSTLNTSKTIVISNVSSTTAAPITYNSIPLPILERNKPFRYLGVYFTITLNWSIHIAKLKQATQFVRKILSRKKLAPNQAALVINTHLIPRLLYGLGIGCATSCEIMKLQRIINAAARLSCNTSRHIINEALTLPVAEAGLGLLDLQHRVDAKILQDADYKFSNSGTASAAARSRLHALQLAWYTPANPLECKQGHKFSTQHEARKAHMFALVRDVMKRYERLMIVTWPPGRSDRGPPLRDLIATDLYERVMDGQPKFWENGQLYIKDISVPDGSRIFKFAEMHSQMEWQKRGKLACPIWYRILVNELCISNSGGKFRSDIRDLIPKSLGPLDRIWSHNPPKLATHTPASPSSDIPLNSLYTSPDPDWSGDPVIIYTDGSFYSSPDQRSTNSMLAGFAWCIKDTEAILTPMGLPSSNRGHAFGRVPGIQSCYKAELYAIYHALSAAPQDVNIILRVDNQAAIAVVSRIPLWLSVRQRISTYLHYLITDIQRLVSLRQQQGASTSLEWVHSHDKLHGDPFNDMADVYAKKGASMEWTPVPVDQLLEYEYPVWIDSHTCQPLEYGIKIDVKAFGLMKTRINRSQHERQGIVFKYIKSAQRAAADQQLPSTSTFSIAPRPIVPSTNKVIPRISRNISTAESRDKQLFLIRLVHSQIPTLHWLNTVQSKLYPSDKCPECNLPDTVLHLFHPTQHCDRYHIYHTDLLTAIANIDKKKQFSIQELTEPFITSLIPQHICFASLNIAIALHNAIYSTIRQIWDSHSALIRQSTAISALLPIPSSSPTPPTAK